MRGRGAVILFAALLLAVPALPIPGAGATHWCDFLEVAISPTSGVAGETLQLSVTVANDVEVALAVESVAVRFPWSTTVQRLGPMTIEGFSSGTEELSVALPSSAGAAGVALSVTGEMAGDISADVCGPFVKTFTVMAQSAGEGGRGPGSGQGVAAPLQDLAPSGPFFPIALGAVILGLSAVAVARRRRSHPR